jgi:hypothetical protein
LKAESSLLTPASSEENGIAVIYQEFNLVGELSVAENIFFGRAPRRGIIIDRKAMVREADSIFKQFDIDVNPNELVSNLTVGYQQLVEIQKANILIMDEPSAPLTQAEAEHLMSNELTKWSWTDGACSLRGGKNGRRACRYFAASPASRARESSARNHELVEILSRELTGTVGMIPGRAAGKPFSVLIIDHRAA